MSMQIKVARAQGQGSGNVMPGIGDPGIFGSIGKFLGGAASFIPGPIGAIASKVLGGGQTVAGPAPVPSTFFAQSRPTLVGPPSPGIAAAAQRAVRGGATGRDPVSGNGVMLACATGFHPNKSDYFLKDGTFIQKGTVCVKNRRRNPLNARAADRAISRIESAKKATKRLSRVTVRKNCS